LEKEIGELCKGLETRRQRANVFQTETMSFHVGRLGIFLLMLYMTVFGTTTTYTLLKIWPADSVAVAPTEQTPATGTPPAPAPPAPGRPAPGDAARGEVPRSLAPAAAQSPVAACGVREPCTDTVVVFQIGRIVPGLTFDFRPPREGRRLIFIALFAGGVGAFLSSFLSLATYIGNRELTRSWAIWYLARPPAGMILALLVYFILRGGLLTPAASVNVLSPYGVAAFSGLIGMFVRQASDKLRDIAEAMFTSRVNQERAEGVHTPAASPTNLAARPGSTEGAATGTGGLKRPADPPKPPARPGGAAR
jgi:hypothetical protein